jgi:hypothetical protein
MLNLIVKGMFKYNFSGRDLKDHEAARTYNIGNQTIDFLNLENRSGS